MEQGEPALPKGWEYTMSPGDHEIGYSNSSHLVQACVHVSPDPTQPAILQVEQLAGLLDEITAKDYVNYWAATVQKWQSLSNGLPTKENVPLHIVQIANHALWRLFS